MHSYIHVNVETPYVYDCVCQLENDHYTFGGWRLCFYSENKLCHQIVVEQKKTQNNVKYSKCIYLAIFIETITKQKKEENKRNLKKIYRSFVLNKR